MVGRFAAAADFFASFPNPLGTRGGVLVLLLFAEAFVTLSFVGGGSVLGATTGECLGETFGDTTGEGSFAGARGAAE